MVTVTRRCRPGDAPRPTRSPRAASPARPATGDSADRDAGERHQPAPRPAAARTAASPPRATHRDQRPSPPTRTRSRCRSPLGSETLRELAGQRQQAPARPGQPPGVGGTPGLVTLPTDPGLVTLPRPGPATLPRPGSAPAAAPDPACHGYGPGQVPAGQGQHRDEDVHRRRHACVRRRRPAELSGPGWRHVPERRDDVLPYGSTCSSSFPFIRYRLNWFTPASPSSPSLAMCSSGSRRAEAVDDSSSRTRVREPTSAWWR